MSFKVFKRSLWLYIPSSPEAMMLIGIYKVPTMCPARDRCGQTRRDPGSAPPGIWLVRVSINNDQCKGQNEGPGPPSPVLGRGLAPSGPGSTHKCLPQAPRPCLPPGSINNLNSPGTSLSTHTPQWEGSPQAER